MSNIRVVGKFNPEDLKVIVKIKDQEETYFLNTKPEFTSQIVLASQKEILQNLSLESVILNLKNSADLMYVAYNALAGTQVQSKMSGLQYELLQASKDSITTVQNFATQSNDVINYITQSYKWLFKAKEDMAVKQLQRCADIAKKMADDAKKLADRFTDIGNRSQGVLQDSTDLMNLKEQERLDLQEKLRDLNAYQANAKELQKQLQTAFDEVQKEYEQAREREKVEGDRAFALGLTSAIIGGLASGLGAIAQTAIAIKSPIGIPGGGGAANTSSAGKPTNPTSANDNPTSSSIQDLNQKLEKAQAEENKLKRQQNELQSKIETNKKNIAQFEGEAKKKEEITLQENENQLKQINAKIDEASKAVKSIMDGLNQISQQIGQLSTQAQSAAELASKQKMEFYKAKNEIAAENRKTLAQIEEYAIRVSNTNVSISNADLAVQTLFCAVQALSRIVTALNETAMFWESMAKYCKRLGDTKFLNDLKDIKESVEPDERIEYYSDPDFLRSAVENLCGWVALNKVCQEYLVAANDAYKLVQQNINSPLIPDEARKQTPKLAEKILKSVRDEKATYDVKAQQVF